MATLYGVLENHISVLNSEVGKLNYPKIPKDVIETYHKFLEDIRVIAKEIPFRQKEIEHAKPSNRLVMTEIITEVTDSLRSIISTLIEKVERKLEKSKLNPYKEDTKERKFLDSIASHLRETGEISRDLLSKINLTQNQALDRYLVSILATKTRSNKYPWTYYVPTISDLKKDKLMDVYDNRETKDSKEIKEKYVHNFMTMIKQVYYMTKMNIRNISMIRLSSLNESSEMFTNYKTILEKLLFTTVDDEFVPGDYDSMSTLGSFSQLLGADNYNRILSYIRRDGEYFLDKNNKPTKTMKTETLIKYILIAIQKVSFNNVDQYTKFYDAIISFIENVLEANKNIADLSTITEVSDKEFNRSDLEARHNRVNNIFTFVKIRVDTVGSLVEPNQRYRVGLDRSRHVMYMGYEPYPDNIYDTTLSLKNEFKYLDSNETILPNNYLFGPFSYIFKPSDDNSTISNHKSMSPLLDNIKNGKSVCVIGYGASGSGKTTALVYAGFEKTRDKRNGILIHFCNFLRQTYGELEVSFLELEGNIKEFGNDAISNFKILPIPEEDKHQLNGDKSPKYIKEDIERQEYYYPRSFVVDPESGEWVLAEDPELDDVDGVKLNKGVSIGKYIVTIMDGKRSVQATTNNPVSSRSHMIIFVKFKNKKSDVARDKEPYLIICDFAGVENKFQCNNPEVLELFEKIKSQTKCKDTNVPKNQCKEFKNFYDVQDQIDLKLSSEDATYVPSPTTSLSITDPWMRATIVPIVNDPYRVDKFTNVAKSINPLLISAYKESKSSKDGVEKLSEFIQSVKNIADIISDREYPKYEELSNALTHTDLDVERWIKTFWSNFKVSKSTKNIVRGKKPHDRLMPEFIKNMYDIGLRADDYNNIYDKTLSDFRVKMKDTSRSMPANELRNVTEQIKSTVTSPLLTHLIDYMKAALLDLESQDSHNQQIIGKINTKNEIHESAKSYRGQALTQICDNRVKEGLFINDSLSYLRSFISHFVTGIQNSSGKLVNPKFIDECAPLQCNPNFEDCFGNTTVLDKHINDSSVIANEIRKRLCCVSKENKDIPGCKPKENCSDFEEITFCVFNVINLSKKANNPPPVPHIDISDLMMELNRLESIKTMLVMNKNINDDTIDTSVHPVYLNNIKNSNLLNDSMRGSLRGDDKKLILDTITILEGYKEGSNVHTTINALKLLIKIINTTNSLSVIGTMEFTDMISKFGLNRTTCNYKYQEEVILHGLKGEERKDVGTIIAEYKSFIINLHNKYNESIIES